MVYMPPGVKPIHDINNPRMRDLILHDTVVLSVCNVFAQVTCIVVHQQMQLWKIIVETSDQATPLS